MELLSSQLPGSLILLQHAPDSVIYYDKLPGTYKEPSTCPLCEQEARVHHGLVSMRVQTSNGPRVVVIGKSLSDKVGGVI